MTRIKNYYKGIHYKIKLIQQIYDKEDIGA